MTSDIAQRVATFCRKNSLLTDQDKVVIGVSGGPDSLCLLHLLKTLCREFDLDLTIAHLNHQLRGSDSQADEAFVRDIAARWQLPIFVETSSVMDVAAKRKQSIEETARQLRYAFLWRIAQKVNANKIAVGHHADDQVETVLMHILRGTGLAGLRGIQPKIDIAGLRLDVEDIPGISLQSAPNLIRPLLETSRLEIEHYCAAHNLSPRQDTSNQETTFFRNRIRHELIPQLETYNPNIRQVIQRTAKIIAADIEILNEHIASAWRFITKTVSSEKIEIDLLNWLNLPLAMRRATLRRAIQILQAETYDETLPYGLHDIGFEHIETAIEIIEKGTTGAKVTLPQGILLTISYQTLTITAQNILFHLQQSDRPQVMKDQVIKLDAPGVTSLPHTDWQLKATLLDGDCFNCLHPDQIDRWEAHLDADLVSNVPIFLRSRQPGDTFCPLGLAGHRKKVAEFMIDEKIPAPWRDYIPLLVTANNQILWVCGYRIDERARLRSTTRRVFHLRFERR